MSCLQDLDAQSDRGDVRIGVSGELRVEIAAPRRISTLNGVRFNGGVRVEYVTHADDVGLKLRLTGAPRATDRL